MSQERKNVVWFDIETTGLSTSKDRIIEICLIKTDFEGQELDKFYSLVNPEGVPSRPEALEVHGIQDRDLLDAPTFRELAPVILEFTEGCDLGGYNMLYFDLPLLVEEMMRAGKVFKWRDRNMLDPFLIQTQYEPRDLGSTYKRMTGKELQGAHGAEADVRATAEIFAKQLDAYGMPRSASAIHGEVLNDRSDMVDLSRKFKLGTVNGRAEVVIDFGKWKGKSFRHVYEQDAKYIDWMIDKGEFTLETKIIAKKLLARMQAERLEHM